MSIRVRLQRCLPREGGLSLLMSIPSSKTYGRALLLFGLSLNSRAANAQSNAPASNTCYFPSACLPSGAIQCSEDSDCEGCTAGAYYFYCSSSHGLSFDGIGYCLEGLQAGTAGVPPDVCAEPNTHGFIEVPITTLEPSARADVTRPSDVDRMRAAV